MQKEACKKDDNGLLEVIESSGRLKNLEEKELDSLKIEKKQSRNECSHLDIAPTVILRNN